MKHIGLTQNKIVIVDKEDYDFLNQWKWHYHEKAKGHQGYAQRCEYTYVGKKLYSNRIVFMHRLIVNCPNDKVVDHINGNTLDNRKSNLRICTQTQNTQNSKKRKNSSSKYKGVYFNKKLNKWRVQITVNKVRRYIASFDNEEDAAICYNKVALKYFGEFAKLNKIESEG